MEYRVALVESAPETVLRVPREIRPNPNLLGEDIVDGMRELTQIAQRAGLTASGAPTITFHHELPADEAIAVEFGVPVEPAPELGPSSGAEVVVVPGTLVARTCHRGSYRDLGAAYAALREWLHNFGYRTTGPPTEAYLIGPDEVTDPRRLLTEIRLPVTPAPAIAIHLDAPFDDAARRTREALRHQGFIVISEVDVQTTLREKIGAEIENYLLLGVLEPRLAHRALTADREAGPLLSGTVVVRSVGTGTLVEATDPDQLVRVSPQPTLGAVAHDARRALAAALDSLRDSAPAST
ncbi:GyrI-like domain-containing protein [Nocardia sp. R6R-6]|uniref:GyrI-like domain-containing protein n=1 Tax=Nocardia sp. R6R-6 TaxID=3459303 RepID=UPI00403DE388